MSNLLWKKKKKKRKNENRKKQKEKKKLQDSEDGTERKKREEKIEHCWTQDMKKKKKKKKERTNIFLNRQYIDWKKEGKKTEHFWSVIVILFWLVVKWNYLSLFEFKGDIRHFFFLFILWNLTKTINRRFYTRFTNNCNYIDSKFFLEFGFSWNRKYFFFGVSVFEKIVGWRESRTDIHPSGFADCCRVNGKGSNSIEEFAGPWSCKGLWRLLIFCSLEFRGWNKRKKAWPTPKFCGWCLGLSVTMMFWIRAWFGKVKRIWERRGAYILVATRVPD